MAQVNKNIVDSKRIALNAKQDLPLAQAFRHFMDPDTFSNLESDVFKYKLKYFENYIGAEYEKISARHWDEEEILPGGNGILQDGYEAIIQGLSAACPIHYNTVVKTIHQHDKNIEITTTQGTYDADVVIVTVPLGVLKRGCITFSPELSISKQQAIQRLDMGLMNVVAMRFSDISWFEDLQACFFAASPHCSMFFNLGLYLNLPIIIGYVGGITGLNFEAQSDQSILDTLMTCFRKSFNQNIAMPKKYFVTRWGNDPYSFGSYSYLPVGSTRQDCDILAQPESNRLFFAGEATSKAFSATTHGAYLSGIREAERIIALYG
ncbi:MAG: FAD-dependent oxidoreductase [Gammaproteobacteria bacterium]